MVLQVLSNKMVVLSGVYTVVTEKDYVVVNGIVASPFANNHFLANAYYGLHRVAYAMVPALFSSQWITVAQEIVTNLIMTVSA